MRQLLCYLVVACLAVCTWAADGSTATKKKTAASTKKKGSVTAHKPASTKGAAATHTSATAHKTASTAKSSTARKGAKTVAARKSATTWRNRQLAPTPDRYREIQNALVAKGYLNSENATGAWNENSIEAMKKFQAEQNLEPSGKINSLSLIALGLGPKHESPAKPTENPQ